MVLKYAKDIKYEGNQYIIFKNLYVQSHHVNINMFWGGVLF